VGGWFKSHNKATLIQQSWSWGLAELGNIRDILKMVKLDFLIFSSIF
jgi:hypothetical protein